MGKDAPILRKSNAAVRAQSRASTPAVAGDSSLTVRNRQRTRAFGLRLLHQVAETLLNELLSQGEYDLGIYLVAAREMTHLNETFLHHEGSTDVITFDYGDGKSPLLHGEIFICVDEALKQSRRFRVPWKCEVVRYLVHGVLHLRGHDDKKLRARKQMKREENRLLRAMTKRFKLG